MKRFIILLILAAGFSDAVGQRNLEYGFEGCMNDPKKPSFFKTQEMPRYRAGLESLKKYLGEYMPDSTAGGKLTVVMIIDKMGKACLSELEGSFPLAPEDIKVLSEGIDAMPQWLPATQNEREVSCMVYLDLQISKGKIRSMKYTNYQGKGHKP